MSNKTEHLKKILKDNGYHVMWIGRNDVIPADKDLSKYCHEYYPGEWSLSKENMVKRAEWQKSWRGEAGGDNYYSFYAGKAEREDLITDWTCIDRAIEYIKNLPQDNEQPFCLYISLVFPHPPYACEDPWYSMINRSQIDDIRTVPKDWSTKASMLKGIYDKQNLQNWDLERFIELRATYLAMVSRLDYQFGLVVEALKKKKIYDDTSIIMFRDHGDYTGDYGIVKKA